ncbi:MAG: RAMP superfamily CRISPR-associated protein [Propionibacteriaceae bacterium]|jgi:CRISPR/Cas system CSM-associated protein Csm3 (group 7 of RAMP superfamily)|nr:RAMP superfamily CRISPR-associated protein [Propionibacteriaceae bacterium]
MSGHRGLAFRDTITGTLTATTPLFIGGSHAGQGTDLVCVRDGQGRLLIPATGLTGALREALGRPHDHGHDKVEFLPEKTHGGSNDSAGDGPSPTAQNPHDLGGVWAWGHQNAKGDGGWASRVTVWDAVAIDENEAVDGDVNGGGDEIASAHSGEAARARTGPIADGNQVPTNADGTDPGEPLDRWDHVSIDRRTGAAATGHLFSREMIRAGTRFRFGLQIETWRAEPEDRGEPGTPGSHSRTEEEHEKVVAWITAVGERLTRHGFTAGGATSSGLGRLDVILDEWQTEDYTGRDGVLAAISAGGKPRELPEAWAVSDGESTPLRGVPPRHIRVTIPWRPLGAVMVKHEVPGSVCQMWPRTVLTRDDDGGMGRRLVIPGSSLKGTLRSRAEFIGRVVTEAEVPDRFLKQMRESTKLPGVLGLFGSAGDHTHDDGGRKGALSVFDVATDAVIPETLWGKVVTAGRRGQKEEGDNTARNEESTKFAKAVDDLNDWAKKAKAGLWFDFVTRNSIDRWTGGVADGMLYSSLEPYATDKEAWRSIIVEIDFDRLRSAHNASDVDQAHNTDPKTALTLFALVLRDLVDGWVPLGFGTTRGLGSIEVPGGVGAIGVESGPDLSEADTALLTTFTETLLGQEGGRS